MQRPKHPVTTSKEIAQGAASSYPPLGTTLLRPRSPQVAVNGFHCNYYTPTPFSVAVEVTVETDLMM